MNPSFWALRTYVIVLKIIAVVKLVVGASLEWLLWFGWAQLVAVYGLLQAQWPSIRSMLRRDLNPPLELPPLPVWPVWIASAIIALVIVVSALSSWAMAQWMEGSLQLTRDVQSTHNLANVASSHPPD